MPQLMPSHRDMLAGNRQLPVNNQQSMVRIRFAKPALKFNAWEFTRIHLTPAMLGRSEDSPYEPELYAKHRMNSQPCPRCRRPQRHAGESAWLWKCVNPQCPRYLQHFNAKPPRGVMRVLIPGDDLTMIDGVEHIKGCVLVLDRRYERDVLAAVYRTAGLLCEELGIRVK